MEAMLQNPTAALQRTAVRLKAAAGAGPFSVELTVDPHVYLHAAELVQALEAHGRMLPQAYKDECSVVWRQVEVLEGQDVLEFGVSWLAIANASPRAEYSAVLTVRDARGRLVEASPGSQNPTAAPGRIGPRHNPTDIGGLSVLISRADAAAARAALVEKRS